MRTSRLSLLVLACALAYSASAYCRHGEVSEISAAQEMQEGPWFTGPLLTPSGHVVPVGYFDFEPYLFVSDTFGKYDANWHAHSIPKIFQVNPLFLTQVGLTNWMDFQIVPQIFYTKSQGQSATRFGDFPVNLDFQLLNDSAGSWWPAIKLVLRESFPTGKYQKLDPKKHGVDGTGAGSYISSVGIVISRLFHVYGNHYLRPRLYNAYHVPSNVHVKGFNVYGGGFGTRGTVRPGNYFLTLFGLEYNLSLHWALALDVSNLYSNKTTFSGKRGVSSTATRAKVGGPSSDQVSLAPAIEYNFNEAYGIIAGAWFTVGGRNAGQFATGVIAFNWYGSFEKEKKSTIPTSQGGKLQ